MSDQKSLDTAAITQAIQRAYEHVPFSNHQEHLMVDRLRGSAAYIPSLALLAEVEGKIAGHLLLTRIIVRDGENTTSSLALAPLSVAPEFQGQGVGCALVNEAHQRARQLGFGSIIVVGIKGYYSRFGYEPLRLHPISVPFKVSPENCAIVALRAGALAAMSGVIEYAPEWMDASGSLLG